MKANAAKAEWADFKRLLELCFGIPSCRKAFLEEPGRMLARYRLKLDEKTAAGALQMLGCPDENIRRGNAYLRMYDRILEDVHQLYAKAASVNRISDPRLLAWYGRQTGRCGFQSRISRRKAGLFYLPVTFELSDGCSMQCPFCCLAAGRLKAVFPYTGENAALWKEVLHRTRELVGDITDICACYFATEPFDNPDYEKFLADFYGIFGRYPQTTTAASARDVKRTKAFLGRLGEQFLRQAALRFSVVSLEQLKEIHQSFSSRELAYVELLLNHPESAYAYCRSGRAVSLSETLKGKQFSDGISCICTCGFVVSLAKRTVKLVAPHRPDAGHPLGMRVYEERAFQTAKDYGRVLDDMMEKWMFLSMPEDQPLHSAAFVTWERSGYLRRAIGDGIRKSVSLSEKEHGWLEAVLNENLPLRELWERERMTEFERQRFKKKIELFYDLGCIEERAQP